MANLKSIIELPVASSSEGVNLIVNDNGAAKQIAASAVGAQADWAEINENSPAFIKNKPIEEYDFDVEYTYTYDFITQEGTDNMAVHSCDFNKLVQKINDNISIKARYRQNFTGFNDGEIDSKGITVFELSSVECVFDISTNAINVILLGFANGSLLVVDSDNSIYFD